MPPAIAVLFLVIVGVPAALRALFGWPRGLLAAWLAAAAAVALGQTAGELLGFRAGVVGDAQMLLALVGATLATLVVAGLERRPRTKRSR